MVTPISASSPVIMAREPPNDGKPCAWPLPSSIEMFDTVAPIRTRRWARAAGARHASARPQSRSRFIGTEVYECGAGVRENGHRPRVSPPVALLHQETDDQARSH